MYRVSTNCQDEITGTRQFYPKSFEKTLPITKIYLYGFRIKRHGHMPDIMAVIKLPSAASKMEAWM
jgi:hypothetical protein